MAKKKTKPDPEFLCHFRGGPWAGKKEFTIGAAGLISFPVPADAENPTAGEYVLAEKLGKVHGENALAYGYDWVPEEEPTAEEDTAEKTGGAGATDPPGGEAA